MSQQQQSDEQDFLTGIKASLMRVDHVQHDIDDVDDDFSFPPFYEDVALFLKYKENTRPSLIVQTLKGLQLDGIESLNHLKSVTRPPDRDKFEEKLSKSGVPGATSRALYDRFVHDAKVEKQQQEQQSFAAFNEAIQDFASWPDRPHVVSSHGKPPLHAYVAAIADVITEKVMDVINERMEKVSQPQHPLLNVLPDIVREVGKLRRSRLNCWERESMRTSGSQRSKKFRRKVIEHYKRASNSRKKVRCQIIDEYILLSQAEDETTGIIAAHIWKASTQGHGLEEFDLRPEDVNSPRNGLFLTKGLEDAFDNQQVCFLYNLLENKIILWVADTSLMTKTITGSGKTRPDGSDLKFSAVHLRPLLYPPGRLPFRRLLSWHARLTLERWPQTIDTERFTSTYDNSPGRETSLIDPISQAINELVNPLEDASLASSSD